MEQHRDGISFEINETLYFEYGQEIEEMLGISLDPDITLQMYENYVQIRGIILLQGEYRKNASDSFGQMERKEDTHFIEKVIDQDESEAIFSHRFPLDISVPNERIDQIENVTVSVEAFDYELPDVFTLKVNATILISGLKEDTQAKTTQETEEEKPDNKQKEQAEAESEIMMMEEADEEADAGLNSQEKSLHEPVQDESRDIDILYKETEETEEVEEIKDVQFLTELFGEKEEETYTKMKIYITQEDDTIESIAKHYQIPALQLMKDNDLTGEGISAGQLLHIHHKN